MDLSILKDTCLIYKYITAEVIKQASYKICHFRIHYSNAGATLVFVVSKQSLKMRITALAV